MDFNFDIEEVNIVIAETISQTRISKRISQRELARRCGISHPKIAMIEGSKGFKKQHGILTLMKVCLELKIKLSDIVLKIEKTI